MTQAGWLENSKQSKYTNNLPSLVTVPAIYCCDYMKNNYKNAA